MLKKIGWVIFSIFGFSASLSKYQKDWLKETPALVPPLEQIRDMGRPISIICLGLLIALVLVAFFIEKRRIKLTIPFSIKCLVCLQLVLALKTLAYGDIDFALQSFILYLSIIFACCAYSFIGLNKFDYFYNSVRSITYVGIIFIAANLYQAFIDIYPITFTNGWFLGTTGNPQHAATLLVCTIPCYLFFIHQPKFKFDRHLNIAFLTLTVLALLLTASRTGLVAAIISVALFYRKRRTKLFFIIVTASLALWLVMPNITHSNQLNSSGVLDKGLNDTRTRVWEKQWVEFSNHPLLGLPLEGDRIRFSENSWLAVASSVGIIGFIPLLTFGASCLSSLRKLNQIGEENTNLYYHCSVVISGLSSLLVGSITEAHLVGILTFPVITLIQYLLLAKFIEKKVTTLEKEFSLSYFHLHSG